MSTKQDGGPAFPQHGWTKDPEILKRMQESGMGMTMRDWFAGQALVGLLSGDPNFSCTGAAQAAYDQADAMLEERAK